MLPNKAYRFIFVSLTLREGKRVRQLCSNRSELVQRHEHLPIFFTLVLPNKRNELPVLNQLRRKETCI